MTPDAVADLDEDEFMALTDAVREREQQHEWGNLHEAVATVAEGIWDLHARLDAGIPVVMVQRNDQPREQDRYPRPTWIKDDERADDDGVIVVQHVSEALRLIRGGAEDPNRRLAINPKDDEGV